MTQAGTRRFEFVARFNRSFLARDLRRFAIC